MKCPCSFKGQVRFLRILITSTLVHDKFINITGYREEDRGVIVIMGLMVYLITQELPKKYAFLT